MVVDYNLNGNSFYVRDLVYGRSVYNFKVGRSYYKIRFNRSNNSIDIDGIYINENKFDRVLIPLKVDGRITRYFIENLDSIVQNVNQFRYFKQHWGGILDFKVV